VNLTQVAGTNTTSPLPVNVSNTVNTQTDSTVLDVNLVSVGHTGVNDPLPVQITNTVTTAPSPGSTQNINISKVGGVTQSTDTLKVTGGTGGTQNVNIVGQSAILKTMPSRLNFLADAQELSALEPPKKLLKYD
jgi:hypothetical protein